MTEEKGKALREMIGIDKNGLQRRIKFLSLSGPDIKLLTRLYKEHETLFFQLVETFYVHLLSFPEMSGVFTSHTIEKHKVVFKQYLEELISGKYDTEYVMNRIDIGFSHYKHKVEPWMYIEAYGKVVDELTGVIDTMELNKEEFTRALAAIFKVILLDISFSLESYFYEKSLAIKRANKLYNVISETNKFIVRTENIDDLYSELCTILVNDGGFRLAWFGQVDKASQYINLVTMCGYGQDFLAGLKISLDPNSPEGRDPAAVAIKEKRIASSNHIMDESPVKLLKDIIVNYGFKSSISVPLFLGEETIDALSVYSDEPIYDAEETFQLLEDIGRDVSFAIESINKTKELEKSVLLDHLTSLPNRRFVFQELKRLMDAASSDYGKKIALIILNVDRFKVMNESYGYAKADLLLKEVGKRLNSIINMPDILGRTDADEFMMVAYNIKDEEAISTIIYKIDNLFSLPIDMSGDKITVRLYKGISIFPDEAENFDELIKIAELSLREAKKAGSNSVIFHSAGLRRKVVDTLNIKKDIYKAFDNEEFVLYYQPKIDIAKNSISGAEALIRWNHPVKGIIPPMKFIPVLEETGLIINVGEWVIKELMRQANLWKKDGNSLKISFNTSALQLEKDNFSDRLIDIAEDMGADPSLIEVEITESMLMKNIEHNIGKLERLKSHGFGISIDDFGTGYSSLSYLQKLPVDILKIDISFIKNLLISNESVMITQAIVVLAKAMGKGTIAEGVDSKEQIILLQEFGCDEVQGFYYSKPVPPPQFEKFVKDFSRQTFM